MLKAVSVILSKCLSYFKVMNARKAYINMLNSSKEKCAEELRQMSPEEILIKLKAIYADKDYNIREFIARVDDYNQGAATPNCVIDSAYQVVANKFAVVNGYYEMTGNDTLQYDGGKPDKPDHEINNIHKSIMTIDMLAAYMEKKLGINLYRYAVDNAKNFPYKYDAASDRWKI